MTEQLIRAMRAELAAAHKALAMGAYGARYTALVNDVARLERGLVAMGVRP